MLYIPDDRRVLLALCLTSRRLRQVAQPILFHCLYYRPIKHTYPPRELELFKRSLDERVDLRRHVQCVDIWGKDTSCDCKDCVAELPLAEEANGLELEELAEKLDVSISSGDWVLDYNYEECLLQLLLMTRLPALKELHMGVHRRWRFPFLAAWLRRGNTLASLKHMETFMRSDFSGINVCSQGHPPNCGHPTLEFTVCRVLVDAAPNLSLLCCPAGALNGLPSLPYLESLQLTVQGSWGDKLERLLKGAPRLRRFAFISGNEHGPSPAEIQRALAPQRETLELLHISTGRRIVRPPGEFEKWEVPRDREWVLSSLCEFKKLKALTIESDMIWKKGQFEENKYLLPRILPESLEVLYIDDIDAVPGPVESLAEAVSAGRFPHLQRVYWPEEKLTEMLLEDRDDVDWLKDGGWKCEVEEQRRDCLLSVVGHAFPDGSDWGWSSPLRPRKRRGSGGQFLDVSEMEAKF